MQALLQSVRSKYLTIEEAPCSRDRQYDFGPGGRGFKFPRQQNSLEFFIFLKAARILA